jgi:hypothetical protein
MYVYRAERKLEIDLPIAAMDNSSREESIIDARKRGSGSASHATVHQKSIRWHGRTEGDGEIASGIRSQSQTGTLGGASPLSAKDAREKA